MMDHNGNAFNITEAFYQDPKSDFAANHFKTGHFTFRYVIQDVTNAYVFSLTIHGMWHGPPYFFDAIYIIAGI